MNTNSFKSFRRRIALIAGLSAQAILSGVLISPTTAFAQKVDEVTFKLVPNPQFADCLRRSQWEEPAAWATVTRGKLNDTLTLVLDGIKPGLAFDLFTVQRSQLRADGSLDP